MNLLTGGFQSMTLTLTIKGQKEKKVVRVAIEPPLKGYDDVKPRLLAMKAEAQEGLGMVSQVYARDQLVPHATCGADQSSPNHDLQHSFQCGKHPYPLCSSTLRHLSEYQWLDSLHASASHKLCNWRDFNYEICLANNIIYTLPGEFVYRQACLYA